MLSSWDYRNIYQMLSSFLKQGSKKRNYENVFFVEVNLPKMWKTIKKKSVFFLPYEDLRHNLSQKQVSVIIRWTIRILAKYTNITALDSNFFDEF